MVGVKRAVSVAKRILRGLLELEPSGIIRFWLWRRVAIRDSLGSFRIAGSNGYRSLNLQKSFLEGDRRASTLFILGSGSSVNSLTREQLSTVSQNVSIGINAWAVHPHIPDVYSFETGQDGDGPSDETRFVSSLLQGDRVVDAQPKFLFLRPTPPATVRNLVQPDKRLSSVRFVHGRANVVTQKLANLERDLSFIVRFAAKGRTPSNVLLDNGASVVRLIFLAALQGYTNIVLVGIDLNRKPYFWDAPDFPGSDTRAFKNLARPRGEPHNSLETLDRPFPVDVFIVALSNVLKREMGVNVSVASSLSSLSDRLQVHRWE